MDSRGSNNVERGVNAYWWKGIFWIALSGLIARIIFVFVSDNIYHPDEIGQYLEQAHRVVFGYGFIPWEYRFGARSWIIPGFISLLLRICKFLNHGDPNIYIPAIKIVFCGISTSLIFSAYVIGRELSCELAGRYAAFFTSFWYEFIYFSQKCLPDILSAYFMIGALAISVLGGVNRRLVLFGVLSACSIVLRPQYLLVVCFITAGSFFRNRKDSIMKYSMGFFVIIAIAGFIDFLTWGIPFLSYYNYYMFQQTRGIASIFGIQPFYYYFIALGLDSAGIFAVCLLFSLKKFSEKWVLIGPIFLILLAHSVIPHKDYRFIFAAIPLLAISMSIYGIEIISKIESIPFQKAAYGLFFIIVMATSGLGLMDKLPYQRVIYAASLASEDDNLKAYRFLWREKYLKGVFETSRRWWDTGGYYYLHRDIPIYFKGEGDFETKTKDNRDWKKYISHIVCPRDMEQIEGFECVGRFGVIEVRRGTDFSGDFIKLDSFSRDLFNKMIDGRFTPNVKRRY